MNTVLGSRGVRRVRGLETRIWLLAASITYSLVTPALPRPGKVRPASSNPTGTMLRRPLQHPLPYVRLDFKPDRCLEAGSCYCEDCHNDQPKPGFGHSHCWEHRAGCHLICVRR